MCATALPMPPRRSSGLLPVPSFQLHTRHVATGARGETFPHLAIILAKAGEGTTLPLDYRGSSRK
jgi:hypothetical protein